MLQQGEQCNYLSLSPLQGEDMEGPRKGTEEGCRLEKGRVRGEGSSSGYCVLPPHSSASPHHYCSICCPFQYLSDCRCILFHTVLLAPFIFCFHLCLSYVNELVLSCHCVQIDQENCKTHGSSVENKFLKTKSSEVQCNF